MTSQCPNVDGDDCCAELVLTTGMSSNFTDEILDVEYDLAYMGYNVSIPASGVAPLYCISSSVLSRINGDIQFTLGYF